VPEGVRPGDTFEIEVAPSLRASAPPLHTGLTTYSVHFKRSFYLVEVF
jgi:hypothetical protein